MNRSLPPQAPSRNPKGDVFSKVAIRFSSSPHGSTDGFLRLCALKGHALARVFHRDGPIRPHPATPPDIKRPYVDPVCEPAKSLRTGRASNALEPTTAIGERGSNGPQEICSIARRPCLYRGDTIQTQRNAVDIITCIRSLIFLPPSSCPPPSEFYPHAEAEGALVSGGGTV